MQRVAELGLRRGGLLCLATVGTFLGLSTHNAGRSFGYDESVTVGFFVARGGLWDAMTSQYVFNNHPLLSGLNWVVYRLGGTSEAWQRVPAIAAGAACVALIVLWSHRRWGNAAAVAAAILIVANPLFIDLSRQARGYSLAALMVTVATIVVFDPDRTLERPRTRHLYATAVGLGLLSHLYVAIAIVGHGVHVLVRRRATFHHWREAAALGGLIALPFYALMASEMLASSRARQGTFVPRFPLDASKVMFGNPTLGLAGVALVGTWVLLRRSSWPFTAGVVASLAGVWIVVQPFDLYPRFLVWTVPLVGLLGASAVASNRFWLLVVVTLGVAGSPHTLDNIRHEPDVRTVAVAARGIEDQGHPVCTAGYYWESFVAYDYFLPLSASRKCEAVIVRAQDADDPRLSDWPKAAILGSDGMCIAAEPAVLRSRRLAPESCAGTAG